MSITTYLTDPIIIADLVAAGLTLAYLAKALRTDPLRRNARSTSEDEALRREEERLVEQLRALLVHSKNLQSNTAEKLCRSAHEISARFASFFAVGELIPQAKRSLDGQKI